MGKIAVVLRTPYRNALTALDAFCSIRKAEGATPATIQLYQSILVPFLKGNPSFLDDSRECILPFISEPENGWSRFTRIKTLKVFCRFLQEEGLLASDPMKGIKTSMPGKRSDVPSMDDVKKFIRALDTDKFTDRRMRVMFLLALDTGLRRGELCSLRIDDLDPEGMTITVRPETSKVKKGRIVPLSPQVARELKRFITLYPPEWKCSWMFPTESGDKLTPSNFGYQIRRAAKRTGRNIKIHGLRHLCATEFLRQTGNIALTAQLLGHSSIATTARFYEHLDLEDLRQAHGKAGVVSGVFGNRQIRKIKGK